MKSVGICSLGCKVNAYESEYIINKLEENNYEIKDFNDICDIYIINTCTVTNQADIKSRKMIRSAIKRNKNACIIVMGCFIESYKEFREEGVDIYLGTKDKSKIIELLDEYDKNKKIINRVDNTLKDKFEDMYIESFPNRTRAFVKIQDGCENYCSYCIIPYVRGKCRSKKYEIVLKEIESLVKNGYKEVVLTGIHTGNYGVDINKSFANLLKDIVKIDGLFRLRISSIEVTELNEKVLEVIKDSNIIVDHLHIPLQAGSDKILKIMNRKYDLQYYKEKIAQIRKIRPDISITTDIIVGHPYEEEEDFLETLKNSLDISFSKIHVFPYSKRSGTKSSLMPQLDNDIKKERARRLLNLSHQLELDYLNKFLDKKVAVLIETNKDGYSFGHTGNYIHVKIKQNLLHNNFYQVRLKQVEYPYIIGEVCNE